MALIDKASLLMVPSTYEAGTLYNVLPSGNRAPDSTDQNSGYDQTRADFTFDRGSNAAATRIGSDGLIKKYRENKLLQSNNFDTTWDTYRTTLTSGQSGYDGTNNAWLLTATDTFSARVQQSESLTGVQVLSVYAKAGTANFIVSEKAGTNGFYAWFDLSNGTIGNTSGDIDTTIEDVGNGWYKCSISGNPSASSKSQFYVAETNGSTTISVGASIYIQNAQLESGLVATDYLDSGATTAKAGVLIDLPRINYDANGENGSLLLETQRVNKFSFSEYFGASDWLKSSSGSGSAPVITDNYEISPEGVKNAARVQFDAVGTAATDRSTLAQRFAFTTGDVYTISCWVKATTGNSTMFHFRANGSQVGGEQIATDEWKLFKATHTATATTTDDYGMQIRGNYSSNTSDVLIYGMQLENASYNTSYIPNHGTSGGVTRAADSCSVTGVSDVIGQTEGTLFVEATNLFASGTRTISLLYTSGSAYYQIYINASNQVRVDVNGLLIFSGGTITTNTKYKIAFAYKSGEYALYINGVQISTSVSTTMPSSLNNFYLGNSLGGEQSGAYNQAVLFNERLTNSELATLTTL